jgi:hypothetical protein
MTVAPPQAIDFLEYVQHKCHVDALIVMQKNDFLHLGLHCPLGPFVEGSRFFSTRTGSCFPFRC